MSKITLLSSLIAAIAFSSVTHAGNATGTITRILVQSPNFVFFSVSGIHETAPSCGANQADFAIDVSTTGGKAQYAYILTQQALGATVVVTGNDACDAWPDRESLNFIFNIPTV